MIRILRLKVCLKEIQGSMVIQVLNDRDLELKSGCEGVQGLKGIKRKLNGS